MIDDFARESQRIIDDYAESAWADRQLRQWARDQDERKHNRRVRWMLIGGAAAVALAWAAMYLMSK